MRKKFKFGAMIVASSLLVTACTSAKETTKEKEETVASYKEFNGFPSFGYDLSLTRHVPFDEITKDNVQDLGLVWSKNFKDLNDKVPNGNQSFPIVVDGVAYVTTSMNYVFAFDAVKGDVIWEWEPPQEVIDNAKATGMPNANRGVAVEDGKVYIITNNVGVAKIDAKTGKTDKYVKLSEYYPELTPENGYYETTAPTVYDGKIFIGSSGGDNGVRGFEMAIKTSDLTPAWDEPFWTTPPKGEDWVKDGIFAGGGAVWMPPSVDPETGIIYFSAGNPAPDFYGEGRPGDNKWSNAVLAVDADTGKLVWGQQQTAHDVWDYDTADSPTIMNATVNGKAQKVVAVGTKGGEWFAYDAATGTPIYENVAFNRQDHPTPTPEGVLSFPGVLGGQNYAPDTFDPKLNLTLIPSIEQGVIFKSAKNEDEGYENKNLPGANAFGTSYAPAENEEGYGKITAIDLNTGKIKWDIETAAPQRGGLTSTATGLTFYGELDGKVKALDTATGENVWEFQTTGSTISAAPSIFEVDGKQYLMITSASRDPQVFVFALGGDKTQAKAQEGESGSVHSK